MGILRIYKHMLPHGWGFLEYTNICSLMGEDSWNIRTYAPSWMKIQKSRFMNGVAVRDDKLILWGFEGTGQIYNLNVLKRLKTEIFGRRFLKYARITRIARLP